MSHFLKTRQVTLEQSTRTPCFDAFRPDRDVTMQVQARSQQIIRRVASQCRCMGSLGQSYAAMHTLFGIESIMAVDDDRVIGCHQQLKSSKSTHEARPSVKNHINNMLLEVQRNWLSKILLEIVRPFYIKMLQSPILHFYHRSNTCPGSYRHTMELPVLYWHFSL